MNPSDRDAKQDSRTEQHSPAINPPGSFRVRLSNQNDDGGRSEFHKVPGQGPVDVSTIQALEGTLPKTWSTAFPLTETSHFTSSPNDTALPKAAGAATTMAAEDLAEKPTWPDNILKEYGKVAKLQDRFLRDQTRLGYERSTASARYSNLSESLAELTKLSEPQGGPKPKASRRKAIMQQVNIDMHSFHVQMEVVSNLEQSLGKLEYKLAKWHAELLELISTYFKGDRSQTRRLSMSSFSSERQPSSAPLDPLENQYYEKRGDVRLLRDKLFNHHTQLQAAIDEHNVPSLPAEPMTEAATIAIRENWLTEHERMEQTLRQEENELRRLWEACRLGGFDVGDLGVELLEANEPQLAAGDEDVIEIDAPPFLPLDPFGLVPDFLKGLHWPEHGSLVAPKLPELGNFNEKRDLITKWVGETTEAFFGATVAPADAVEFDHHISPPRSEPEWSFVHKGEKISEDFPDADFVMIAAVDGTAENGEPLQHAAPRKVVRKAKSDNELRIKIPKWIWRSSPRASTDVRHGVDARQL